MITIAFKMTIKQDRSEEFKKYIPQMTESAHASGCLLYEFYTSMDRENDFLLYEKWTDQKTLDVHLKNLHRIFKSTSEDYLPKDLLDFFESTEDIV